MTEPESRLPTSSGGPARTTPAATAVRKLRRAYDASTDDQRVIHDPWITPREALALLRWIESR